MLAATAPVHAGPSLPGGTPAQWRFLMTEPVLVQGQRVDAPPGIFTDQVGAAAPFQRDDAQVKKGVAAGARKAIARVGQQLPEATQVATAALVPLGEAV